VAYALPRYQGSRIGILVAAISEVAKRYPGFGGLIASLPLVSVLGMIWLWRDRPDAENMKTHAEATFWFVLPSLPMFLIIAAGLLARADAFEFLANSRDGWALINAAADAEEEDGDENSFVALVESSTP